MSYGIAYCFKFVIINQYYFAIIFCVAYGLMKVPIVRVESC